MRKAVRVVFLFLLSLLSTAVLGVVMALMSAVSLAATALIVPGTGTPDADVVTNYREHAIDRYSAPYNPWCTSTNGCELEGIDYPASFFPLVIFSGWCEPGRCDTWNDSVGKGVDGLYTAIEDIDDSEVVVFGYSQGGAVVSNTLRRIQRDDPDLLDKIDSVVMIGNAYNPDGGLFTRLGFLPTIPFFDITFGPATPVDTGVDMTGIGFEYDPVMYAPHFWGNGLAMLNALAAFETVHGYYLTPDGNGPTDPIAYGYTEEELAEILETGCPGAYCRVGSEGNKYYMIPAKGLPLMNLISSFIPEPLRPFTQPIIELVTPALKVLIDLGYDWSGDPDKTRYLSILPFNPFNNWVQVGIDLVEAVVEGVENAFGGGGSMTIAPAEEEALTVASSQRSAPIEEPAESKPALTVVPEVAPAADAADDTDELSPVTGAGEDGTVVDDGTGGDEDGNTGDDGTTGDDTTNQDGTTDGDDETGEDATDDDVTTDPEGTKDDETDIDADDADEANDAVTAGDTTDTDTDTDTGGDESDNEGDQAAA